MATSFADGDAGPLDDYFRDEGDDTPNSVTKKGQNLSMQMEMEHLIDQMDESGDITLVNQSSPIKGWTGVLPNTGGPSNNILVPGKFPSPNRMTFEVESFAERFKYLICSSGLLEKDHVPASIVGLDTDSPLEDQANHTDQWDIRKVWLANGKERWDLLLAGMALLLGLILSLGVLKVLGFGVMVLIGVGWYNVVYTKSSDKSAVVVAPISSTVDTPQSQALDSLIKFISHSHALNTTLSTSLSLLDPYPYNIHTHHSLRVTLYRLTGNMTDHLATATSTLLELTDRKELAVLGEMYDIPVVGSFFYSRRNRNISDTSSEEGEAEGLLHQSQIDKPRSTKRPEIPHRPKSNPSPTRQTQQTSSGPTCTSSSPLKALYTHRSSFSSPNHRQDRFTQIPDRTPRLSKRASVERLRDTWSHSPRPERPYYERRITEADEEEEEDEEDEGKEEEEAEAEAEWNNSRSSDQSMSSDDTPTFIVNPNYDKESEITSPKSPGLGVTIPRTPTLTQGTPRGTSSPFQHIPSPLSRRLSSASERLQPLRTASLVTPSRSVPGSTTLLPSPFDREPPPSSAPLRAALSLDPVSIPHSKRRSLQNMPYYHSSDDDNETTSQNQMLSSSGLTRTRSMPLSDLQALRSASTAGGSKSRRSSFNPSYPGSSGAATGLGIGIGYPSSFTLPSPSPSASMSISMINKRSSLNTSPPPSPNPSFDLRRVESLSPLTVPALKASCLGMHLKRRRLACCLLGLKFGEDDTYWKEVKSVLDNLIKGMLEEKHLLETLSKESEVQDKVFKSRSPQGTKSISTSEISETNRWSAESIFPFIRNDFAPRTSSEANLMDHIDRLGLALTETWKELSSTRANLTNGEMVSMLEWTKIRGKLGDIFREWERGKDVLNDIYSQLQPQSQDEADDTFNQANSKKEQQGDSESREDSPIPDFIKSWNALKEENNSVQNDHDTSLDQRNGDASHQQGEITELLPPVGRDMIFEATSLPLSEEKTLLSTLSREERIKLSKEARGKGISLKDLLGSQSGQDGDKMVQEEMRKKGGLVVDELRNVIGSIRKLKGGESDDRAVENEEVKVEEDESSEIKIDRLQYQENLTILRPLWDNMNIVNVNGTNSLTSDTRNSIQTTIQDGSNDLDTEFWDGNDVKKYDMDVEQIPFEASSNGHMNATANDNDVMNGNHEDVERNEIDGNHETISRTHPISNNPFALDLGELQKNLRSKVENGKNHEDDVIE
ncbi:uncharacterized protein IL334_007358 [Kwoniella shivajii]|uniref:Myosin-binding domain-containing protein n=1 Tax=Kwoniella shivajii TaxID=564305 RepID=A0ABZ1D8F6_9TREE|nr:hypothetical protein IL334_007358 [Kwoniella shivajii]